ncbi:PKD domain-containing protein [bacterium]|nr:PKD domain-containing protein [bacterium]
MTRRLLFMRAGTLVIMILALAVWAPGAPAAPGDINRSGRVDGEDLVELARRIGQPTDPNDARDFDLDKNGVVEVSDQGLLQRNFGLRGVAAAMWVSDTSGHRVRKLSPLSGRVLAEVSGFAAVSRLVVGPNNDAYLADSGSIFRLSGELLGAYSISSGTGFHGRVAGFGTNLWHDVNVADGRLWVINKTMGRLYRIEPSAFSVAGYNVIAGTGHHSVFVVSGGGNIAVDGPRGVIWMAWGTRSAVLRMRTDAPDGYNPVNDTGYHTMPSVTSPGLVSLDPTTGRLWVTRAGSEISLLSADGNTLTAGQSGLSTLNEIAADAKNGGCWFARSNTTLGLVDSAAANILLSTTTFAKPLQLVPMRDTGWLWFVENDRDPVLVTQRGDVVLRRAVDGRFAGASVNPLPPDARSPVVDLLISNAEPSVGGNVNFTAFVLEQREPVVAYRWDFDGDGRFDRTTSTASTSFAYNRQMLALPMVEAIDDRGFSGFSGRRTVVPGYLAAVVEATPTAGDLPLLVQFTGSYFDPLGTATVLNYRYDFDGDGVDDYTSPTNPNASFTYQAAGEFDATFKITFVGGRVSTAVVRISTNRAGPTAVAGVDKTGGVRPLTVTFYSDQSSDADGQILLYEWDFDNNGTFDYAAVTSQPVPYTYANEGDYTATLRVTDNSGLTDTDSVAVRVGPPTPIAVASAAPTLGHAPLDVQFTGDQSQGVGASLVRYEWHFGDGDLTLNPDGFPTRQLFVGTYTSTGADDITSLQAGVLDASPSAGQTLGNRTWTLRSDDDGVFSWANIFGGFTRVHGYCHIYLYSPAAQTLRIQYRSRTATRFWVNGALIHAATYVGVLPGTETVVPLQLAAGWNQLLVSCASNGSAWELGYRITDALGRGVVLPYRVNLPTAGTPAGYYVSNNVPNTNHTYAQPGLYWAQLIVTDARGYSDRATAAVTVVHATAPIAFAQATPNQGPAPLLVQLTGTGTNDPNGNITRYRWDFEGGNLSENAEGAPRVVAEAPWSRTSVGVAPGRGQFCWTDSPGGNYTPNTNASLRTFPVDLSSATTGFLRFYQRYNFGGGDFGYLERSVDGGRTWQSISSYSSTFNSWHQVKPNTAY